MDQSALERRIRALELTSMPLKGTNSGAGRSITDTTSTVLEDLAGKIRLIGEDAFVAGDHRLFLACAREFCRVAELSARLLGEIEEKTTTNVLNVHLDAETAERVAKTYLARRKKLESHE